MNSGASKGEIGLPIIRDIKGIMSKFCPFYICLQMISLMALDTHFYPQRHISKLSLITPGVQ